MRKIYLSFSILITFVSNAQVTSNWLIGGNTTTVSVPYFGTNSNNPIVFKTNGLEVFRLKTNGDLKVFNFDDGLYGGVVLTNQNGVLQKLPFGTGTKVLFDDGTWGNLPSTSSFWMAGSGSKIYYTAGKVGIGTTTPNFDLDVQGSARITNTLIVNGQLIISDKIQTSRQLKSMRVESDSIMMDSTRALYGKTLIQGDVQAKYNLAVDGNITTNGFITAKQGLTFDGINGLKYTPSALSSGAIYSLGSSALAMPFSIPCPVPGTPGTTMSLFNFSGVFRASSISGMVNATTEIYNTPWNGFGHIEVQGTDQFGGSDNELLINFWCGRNTGINTGPNGGKVSMGKHVDIGLPISTDLAALSSVALGVIQNSPFGLGLAVQLKNSNAGTINTKLTVKADNQIALLVEDENFLPGPATRFQIMGNGQTYIGLKKAFGGHANAMLSVDGKALFKSIYVSTSSAVWADYVFEDNYKLMTLKELEIYYLKNKHLPEIPTAKDVENEMLDIGKMEILLLKKVEELTLYIVQLEKDIKKIKENIKN